MTSEEPIKRDPVATRQLLLDVAAKAILEKGLAGMTLDAVAKEAGVSKGGLLHHFPSKQHLIDEIITDLHQQFLNKWKKASDTDPEETGKLIRAYLKVATLERDEHACKLCNIIAVEDRGNVTLRTLWRKFLSSLLNPENAGGADPVTLAIVQLATDGLWLAEMEGIFNDFPELQKQVIERLHEMTHTPASNSES